MTVGELIELLEDMDHDLEVRFAQQPNWPFEYSVADARWIPIVPDNADDDYAAAGAELVRLERIPEDQRDAGWQEEIDTIRRIMRECREKVDSAPAYVYLVEGRQIGYLPGAVKDELGW